MRRSKPEEFQAVPQLHSRIPRKKNRQEGGNAIIPEKKNLPQRQRRKQQIRTCGVCRKWFVMSFDPKTRKRQRATPKAHIQQQFTW